MIDSYTIECDLGLHETKIETKTKTNADRIRSMTDEELAELMDNAGDYFLCDICEFREPNEYGEGCIGRGCKNYILRWLKEEVEKGTFQ